MKGRIRGACNRFGERLPPKPLHGSAGGRGAYGYQTSCIVRNGKTNEEENISHLPNDVTCQTTSFIQTKMSTPKYDWTRAALCALARSGNCESLLRSNAGFVSSRAKRGTQNDLCFYDPLKRESESSRF